MKKILNFKKFIKEDLNISNLDLRTKKEILANLKLRLLELKSSWRLDTYTELSLLDIRNISRQFENEFGKDLIDDIKLKDFLEEASSLFPNKTEVIKLINKFIQKIDSL
jgi:hypothetical protein